jgi:radical SAM superfamily enzyme YgiQ (UPF0313 family)
MRSVLRCRPVRRGLSNPAHPLLPGRFYLPHRMRAPGDVLLISCYELGHRPLGTAWAAGFLTAAGFDPAQIDLAVQSLDVDGVRAARFIGISVPMHTALRLGVRAAGRIRSINPDAFVCFYGLYATLNAELLLSGYADAVLGGEYEAELVHLVEQVERGERLETRQPPPALRRLTFPLPRRAPIPSTGGYAELLRDGRRVPTGYVEASRGCLHHCRHCPIPAVYGGRFFVVPPEIVLEDIRRLAAEGAQHITFGDPDFLNGPGHAVRVARALHDEFPALTFDVTAKIEHLVKHAELIPELAGWGCLFVVSAAESLSDTVLARLAKGHTRADIVLALDITRRAGVTLRPTFVAFTPWTTLGDYLELLDFVDHGGLVDDVDPVQYALRLLVPPGSLLERDPAMQEHLGELDRAALTYHWTHPDPRMDRLQRTVSDLVEAAATRGEDASGIHARVREAAEALAGRADRTARRPPPLRARPPSPRLTEPWFC